MNLTKPTNNLHSNLMIAGTQAKVPAIGDAATVCYAKDRHACTIIAYDEKRKIVTIQQDKATRTDSNGMSDSQDYSYEPQKDGRTWDFKIKDGKWLETIFNKETNRWKIYRGGTGLILGIRDEFYDFTF